MLAFHLPQTDSTNTQAQRLAAEHPGQALFVWADEQVAGRGRNGRVWHSPIGGAWLSVAWPIAARTSLEAYAAAPLVVGYAVLGVLRQVLDEQGQKQATLQIKWPNDILLQGRKVAGILCERTVVVRGPSNALVVGLGVNANLRPADLPADIRYPATSLLDLIGHSINLERLVHACVLAIAQALESLGRDGLTAPTVTAIESHLAWRGQTVQVTRPSGKTTGALPGPKSCRATDHSSG